MEDIPTMAMRGRQPTARELLDLGERISAFGLQTIEASANLAADALAPVHGTVTANARRLARGKRRART